MKKVRYVGDTQDVYNDGSMTYYEMRSQIEDDFDEEKRFPTVYVCTYPHMDGTMRPRIETFDTYKKARESLDKYIDFIERDDCKPCEITSYDDLGDRYCTRYEVKMNKSGNFRDRTMTRIARIERCLIR